MDTLSHTIGLIIVKKLLDGKKLHSRINELIKFTDKVFMECKKQPQGLFKRRVDLSG